MKNLIMILLVMLFLSCANNNKPLPPPYKDVVLSRNTDAKADSDDMARPDTAILPDAKTKAGATVVPKVKGSDAAIDNMRGYDPRSEDDMGDNGMSRFMENNDEEGWE